MQSIQEYNNSIYYREHNKIIEYDLLARKNRVRYVVNNIGNEYYVLTHNSICIKINESYYVNSLKLVDIDYRIFVLQTPNQNKYIVGESIFPAEKLTLYDLRGSFIKLINTKDFWISDGLSYSQLDVSIDGRIITWYRKIIYIFFLDNNFKMMVTCQPCSDVWETKFVFGSSRLAIINVSYVKNLYTSAILDINMKDAKYYDTKWDIMLCLSNGPIQIYGVVQLNSLVEINHNHEFIHYHKKLNLLITKGYELFVIESNHKLKHVNVGINYIMDRTIIPNLIMEIISDLYLFDLLPYEIVYVELYQRILCV